MADTVHGWFSYRSNGQPGSDSARRMAALAIWDWEGGDRDRGFRLLYGAYRLGVADSLFYYHGAFALRTFQRDSEALAFAEAGLERWPTFPLLWSVKGDALQHLGRQAEARTAKSIADSLRRLTAPSGAHAP